MALLSGTLRRGAFHVRPIDVMGVCLSTFILGKSYIVSGACTPFGVISSVILQTTRRVAQLARRDRMTVCARTP